ncbi:putative SWI/SNF-related matrix-associated actin-dependent regulator of chromatin subfamily A member 3-like 1 [Quercus lobata]|uniref:putative SWI/SNF-related matrix-associated actin-dependent regulator of chromatin subfamily A member 3-like 1 n=1 Tax=Quercus lobata TaxID=97700 RepID=UPI001244AA2F|nr:putative SWI/SNF-related matrix-associated actin-dependent regulator of chromatin subfamily A member 3-like 1 [Quercus lobata]
MSLLRLQQSYLESLEELSHLQVLMETISLRRTKDNGLIVPLKTIENYYVEFSKEELQLYNIMEEKAKHVFQDYVDSECDLSKLEAVIITLLQLRQLCIDLGLCASNIKSKLLDENIEGSIYNVIETSAFSIVKVQKFNYESRHG